MRLGKNEKAIIMLLQNSGEGAVLYPEMRGLFPRTVIGAALCSQTIRRLTEKELVTYCYSITSDESIMNTKYWIQGHAIYLWVKNKPVIDKRYHLTDDGIIVAAGVMAEFHELREANKKFRGWSKVDKK